MNLLVDDRVGSRHLVDLLPGSVLTRLESGDVAWEENGVSVGIEIKRVTDALSSMFTSRLADTQLPAMSKAYDVRYLIVEDLYRSEPGTGILQRFKWFKSSKDTVCGVWVDAHAGRTRMMYRSFEMWLHTMTMWSGTHLEKTSSPDDTAALILALHDWHSRADHKSFRVLQDITGETAELTRPDFTRRVAALLSGIGWEKSKKVVERFASVAEMVNATEKDWTAIDGIGKTIAKRAVEALNGCQT